MLRHAAVVRISLPATLEIGIDFRRIDATAALSPMVETRFKVVVTKNGDAREKAITLRWRAGSRRHHARLLFL